MKAARYLAMLGSLAWLVGSDTSAAEDSFLDGARLRGLCAAQETAPNYTCHGYVMAVADAMTSNPISGRRACVRGPSDDSERAVLNFLNRNPRLLSENAAKLVAIALSEAFPCRR